jgi:N-methylhydantoinase A/oxoprolinase/acetone carboxylase beta subunit
MYRIGVDVGGTNTDSAVLDITALDTPSRGVIASAKSPTTRDITGGIELVIKDVLAKSKVQKSNVLSVNIGTTHFVNAVAEADERRLSKVAVVRLCGPFTRQLPPFVDFPVNLKKIIDGGVHYLDGGLEIDGREISPLNLGQIKTVVGKVRNAGIKTIAVVGVFSPLDHSGAHEERCKSIMHQLDPSLEISCSHSIGPPGFLERENATILNASILAAAKIAISGFRNAISRLHLTCPLYLTQNDGTLTDAATALEFPIKTFASGPTNSAIGAAFLGGLDKPREVVDGQPAPQVMVVDIGGTTTDVCALLPSGFPRQAPAFVEVGGVRTAFSMPEVCSIGLGGGSRIGTDTATGQATVGPDSTGHLITSQALVFGGGVMTATDIVVASGKANIGNVALVANIPPMFLKSARQQIKKSLETVIEEMKVSAEPVTVLLVGGGSIVLMDELDGVARCIHPPHHDSANAVGAAIAKVAGEIDVIEVLEGRDEKAVVNSACAKAIQAAIDKGARKDDVKIAAIDKIPLQYVSNKATRIVVKAVGSLGVPKSDMSSQSIHLASLAEAAAEGINWEEVEEESKRHGELETQHSPLKPSLGIDIPNYRPDVKNGVWYLSDVDLEFIASGTGVLGTGGGGPSYHGFLMALDALHNAGPGKMRVISPKSLKDSDICSFGCWYGAPSIINERPSSGTEIQTAIDAVMKISGYTDFQAIVGDEIGGGNGMAAFPVGKYYDKPIVDADGMGRAYPTAEHSKLLIPPPLN